MLYNSQIFDKNNNVSDLPKPDPLEAEKKPYIKPRLEEMGDLRAVTLGGSPGIGDSGIDPQLFI